MAPTWLTEKNSLQTRLHVREYHSSAEHFFQTRLSSTVPRRHRTNSVPDSKQKEEYLVHVKLLSFFSLILYPLFHLSTAIDATRTNDHYSAPIEAIRSHHHHPTPNEAITACLVRLDPRGSWCISTVSSITLTTSRPSFSQILHIVAIAHDPEPPAATLWTVGLTPACPQNLEATVDTMSTHL